MSLTPSRLSSALRKIERIPYTPYQRHRLDDTTSKHPWRVFTHTSGAGYVWTVSDSLPEAYSSYPTGSVAGKVVQPNGTPYAVNSSGWTGESSGVTVYLKLTVSGGGVSGSFVNTSGSGSYPYASPAVLLYPLAEINFSGGICSVSQRVNEDVNMFGTVIPAWYSGYNTARYQYFLHKNTAAPEWVTAKDCSGTEISGA